MRHVSIRPTFLLSQRSNFKINSAQNVFVHFHKHTLFSTDPKSVRNKQKQRVLAKHDFQGYLSREGILAFVL